MTLANSILNDFTMFDGLETVTLTPQNPAGTPVTTVQALRRVLSRKIIAMFGELAVEPTSVPFILFVGSAENVSLSGSVPTNGDKITDAGGTVWDIEAVSQQTLQSRYTCLCKKQVSF
jgi:hypothetical protein